MSLRGGTTKQSHALQGGYASVRLPRYARNDMVFVNFPNNFRHPNACGLEPSCGAFITTPAQSSGPRNAT